MIHTFSYDNFNNLEEVVGLRLARVLRLINFHAFFGVISRLRQAFVLTFCKKQKKRLLKVFGKVKEVVIFLKTHTKFYNY